MTQPKHSLYCIYMPAVGHYVGNIYISFEEAIRAAAKLGTDAVIYKSGKIVGEYLTVGRKVA